MREIASVHGKIGLGLMACFLLAAFWLGGAPEAQEVPGTISRVETDDRKVILEWTPLPADTMTASERQRIPQATFVVPDLLGITADDFDAGDQLAGRGGLTSTPGGDLEVVVGAPEDLFLADEDVPRTYPATFELTGAFQFGRNYVAVAFSQPVNGDQARQTGNYSFSPDLSIESIRVQENEQIAIMQTSGDLGQSISYTVTVNGVGSRDTGASISGASAQFTTLSTPVLNIAEVQENGTVYDTLGVTVIGSVYIPVRNGNTVPSGYIQDGSRRGIRVTGPTFTDALNAMGNVVSVTGDVELANFATWLDDTLSTATVIASGQPRLAPRVLDVKDSKEAEFRGNFIQTHAKLNRQSYSASDQLTRFDVSRSDTSFGGYRIWRSESPDPEDFVLLRSFSLLDSTWGYSEGGPRIFADPDSIIPRGTEHDRLRDPNELVAGPFNGFAYYYAVTWFDAFLDPSTTPSRVTIFERTTIEDGMHPGVIFPSKKLRVETPLLGDVKVVPNPYNPDGAFDQQAFPGDPRVQFINLPAGAKVDVYTMAGDYVRTLRHEESDDSLDWDLKNDDGQDVAPGIYIYYIEASGETTTGRFVIIR